MSHPAIDQDPSHDAEHRSTIQDPRHTNIDDELIITVSAGHFSFTLVFSIHTDGNNRTVYSLQPQDLAQLAGASSTFASYFRCISDEKIFFGLNRLL